jgi:hypothetical protein
MDKVDGCTGALFILAVFACIVLVSIVVIWRIGG